MKPKDRGAASAAKILAAFTELGISVSVPWGDTQRYDFIIDVSGSLFRVQAKTARMCRGAVLFRPCSVVQRSPKRQAHQRRYVGEVDLFAVYSPHNRKTYIVPFSAVGKRASFAMRLETAKNNQRSKTRQAHDFEIERWYSRPARIDSDAPVL